jgi:CBS domain containing-hemolysin-like protein
VTLEDVLETLLGVEIVDEFDSVDDMRAYAVEKWRQKRLERNI